MCKFININKMCICFTSNAFNVLHKKKEEKILYFIIIHMYVYEYYDTLVTIDSLSFYVLFLILTTNVIIKYAIVCASRSI